MYEKIFITNMAAAIKISQIDSLVPDYNDGHLYATMNGYPVLVFECPIDQKYETVLNDCIKTIQKMANDPEKKDAFWSAACWYRDYHHDRVLRGD